MRPSRKRALVLWLASIGGVIAFNRLAVYAGRLSESAADSFGIFSFLSWVLCIALTLYLAAVTVRFILKKLFWRVGRRLALSYFLIGVLPFIFFAVMLAIAGYLMAGVLSQAAFRDERNATIDRLETWNLEYALSGVKPPSSLPSLEIFDVANRTGEKLPRWLRKTSFVGLARRGEEVLFVSSRLYNINGSPRTVVFAQPMDDAWGDALQSKNGMIVSVTLRAARDKDGITLKSSREKRPVSVAATDDHDPDGEIDVDGEVIGPFVQRNWRNGIIWGDFTPKLVSWEDGEEADRGFIMISNRWRNLLDYYFGSSDYVNAIFGVIAGFATLLAIAYFFAVLLAGGLIFSITRAVNRIEKGTKAVERGDFSYRIGLKPRNQLGEVATSFDRMTSSVAGLLSKVAEKERLQSEIDIAASIQRNLLPKEGPSVRGVSFSAHFEPTASIGGDYYDVFSLDTRRLAVAIGDVSGHGLSTGLVMAMVKAAITTLVEEGADELSLFMRLNELVRRSTEKRAFMTLGFTIFDLDSKTIRHTNAGHLYPYLLRKGSPPRAIEVPSLPLGLRADIDTRTVEIPLEESDSLVYLSDGIIEATNANGDAFGFDRLEMILAKMPEATPAAVQAAILSELALHTGQRVSEDDRTIMVLRFDAIETVARPYVEEELAPAVG